MKIGIRMIFLLNGDITHNNVIVITWQKASLDAFCMPARYFCDQRESTFLGWIAKYYVQRKAAVHFTTGGPEWITALTVRALK